MAGKIRREVTIGGPSVLLGFSGRDSVDSAVFDAAFLTLGGVNEVQTITITGTPTGGTFTLSLARLGQNGLPLASSTTTALAFNASAATVQAALLALPNVPANSLTVTGGPGPGTPYVVTFIGGMGKLDVPLITASATGLTGGTTPAVSVVETVKGSSTFTGLYRLTSGTILASAPDGKSVRPYTAAGQVNEVQTVTVSGTPTGGTLTLLFEGEETANIAFNATAGVVQAALEGLPNLDPGDITVTGGPGPGTPWVLTFVGPNRGGVSVPLVRPGANALTGGTTPAVAVAQTTNGADTEQIVGIFDGTREFFSPDDDEPIPVYNFDCVFDVDKIPGYATYAGALKRWALANGCKFKSQGV